MLFRSPLIKAISNKETLLEIHENYVYPGLMGLRGDAPGGWVDGSDNMHRKVLSSLKDEISRSQSWGAIDIKLMVVPDTAITGECRVNGAISTKVCETLSKLNWPREKGYLFKQTYILRGKLPNKKLKATLKNGAL